MEELIKGTRMAWPFSLPFRSGKMRVMAVADPVVVGARLTRPERARRKSDFFALGASTIVCVLVTLCTVVMLPRTIPIFSWITCGEGSRRAACRDLQTCRGARHRAAQELRRAALA